MKVRFLIDENLSPRLKAAVLKYQPKNMRSPCRFHTLRSPCFKECDSKKIKLALRRQAKFDNNQ
ncbi:MAG: hypothetical protein WBG70_18250 [Spirulinaceae cyanobacterium]